MTTHFLIVTQRAWMNESGYGISYACVSPEFSSRETAIRWASGQFDHGDLNVATITDGRLVAFGPDTDGAPHGGHDLAEIAEQIGLAGAVGR